MSVLFKDKITGLWKRAAANLIYAAFPVGSIVAYGGSSDVAAPAGCMYCHGQVLNSADYPDLYDVIGTKFGVGDGSAGSFSLPELRGEFLRGAGANQRANCGSGASVGSHQDPTYDAEIFNTSDNKIAVQTYGTGNYRTSRINYDSAMDVGAGAGKDIRMNATTYGSGGVLLSSRPTNTSVEYIIKVVK